MPVPLAMNSDGKTEGTQEERGSCEPIPCLVSLVQWVLCAWGSGLQPGTLRRAVCSQETIMLALPGGQVGN